MAKIHFILENGRPTLFRYENPINGEKGSTRGVTDI